jgi:hypothetical protein
VGCFKEQCVRQKTKKLKDLKNETEITSADILRATMQDARHYVARHFQQCICAGGGYFEHLPV